MKKKVGRQPRSTGFNPRPKRHWLIYIRQSKKKRNAAGIVTTASLELQEKTCREAIAALDASPAAIELITDHGRPGGRGQTRPGRDELLRRVEAGEANAVMAYKASRIGRDIEESEHLWNRCADAGAFISAADCHDLSNPIVRSVLFGMAQQENQDRRDYSTAILERRRAQGLPPVKTGVAYGLRWNGDELEPDPEEFPVVERAFRWADQALSAGEIARRLTAAEVPRRNVGHCQWDRSAVSRMLRSSWYIGLVPDGDGFWSAGRTFIDPELAERVSARFRTVDETGQQLTRALSGLLYCAECGGWSPMSLCYSRKKRNDGSVLRRDRYRCIHRVRDPEFCPGQSIDALEVERFLLGQLRAALGDDELSQARLEHRRRRSAEDGDGGVAEHVAAIEQVRGAERKLFARRQGGEVIPDFLYNEEMSRLEAECRRHERARELALEQAGANGKALARLRSEAGDVLEPERWFELPAAARGQFLRLLFPNGVAVERAQLAGAPAPGRLRPRTPEEVAAAEELRVGAAKPPAQRRRPKPSSSKRRSRKAGSRRTASKTASSRTSGK